jgi:hypothetical protein
MRTILVLISLGTAVWIIMHHNFNCDAANEDMKRSKYKTLDYPAKGMVAPSLGPATDKGRSGV